MHFKLANGLLIFVHAAFASEVVEVVTRPQWDKHRDLCARHQARVESSILLAFENIGPVCLLMVALKQACWFSFLQEGPPKRRLQLNGIFLSWFVGLQK